MNTLPHVPLGHGVNGTHAHYERLSRDVLRLDHTVPHVNHRRRRGFGFWLQVPIAIVLLVTGIAMQLGWRPFA